MNIQREGRDHDPVQPWVWATVVGRTDPVEIVSYPVPHENANGEIDNRATIMVRMKPGDPTTLREIPFNLTACFDPSRHEWASREKQYYSDNPTVFHFVDELPGEVSS